MEWKQDTMETLYVIIYSSCAYVITFDEYKQIYS